MTEELKIIVPHGHTQDPTCPHCFAELGDHLTALYPNSDLHVTGPECDGPIHVLVDRPSPTFVVEAPNFYGDNVRHIGRSRR